MAYEIDLSDIEARILNKVPEKPVEQTNTNATVKEVVEQSKAIEPKAPVAPADTVAPKVEGEQSKQGQEQVVYKQEKETIAKKTQEINETLKALEGTNTEAANKLRATKQEELKGLVVREDTVGKIERDETAILGVLSSMPKDRQTKLEPFIIQAIEGGGFEGMAPLEKAARIIQTAQTLLALGGTYQEPVKPVPSKEQLRREVGGAIDSGVSNASTPTDLDTRLNSKDQRVVDDAVNQALYGAVVDAMTPQAKKLLGIEE